MKRVFNVAEAWLNSHLDWLVWLIVLVGFYLRYNYASDMYFNSDEQQIMLAPLKRGLAEVIRAAPLPYGPLMNIVLHVMSFFGSSELYFRMPSILAGSLLPVVAFRWAREAFDKTTALVVALILGFAPELVIQSAQVRHYMPHLFFLVCSLYCLEKAFRQKSPKWMRLFGATLLLSLLTLYISAWYIGAAGVYALVRILKKQLPWRLVLEWAAIQIVAASILITAYLSLATDFHGTKAELAARNGWMRGFYYHPEDQLPLEFLYNTTNSLFGYVFAHATLATWTMIAFLFGVALILLRKGFPPPRPTEAILLVMPLIITATAAFMGMYPYGGTRHDAFLSVFAAAGVGVAISFLVRGKLVVLVLAAIGLVPAWVNAAQHHYLDDYPRLSRLNQMNGALSYLSSRKPPARVLFVDQSGACAVNFYVCHGQLSQFQDLTPEMNTYRCGDYQVLQFQTWVAPRLAIPPRLAQARQIAPQLFPDPVWLFQASYFPGESEPLFVEGATFGKIDLRLLSPMRIVRPPAR